MLGAIAGGILGTAHRRRGMVSLDTSLLTVTTDVTPGTVLTIATAHALTSGIAYDNAYREFAQRHPAAGYGPALRAWLADPLRRPRPCRSDGASLRVVPVGFAGRDLQQVLREARASALPTHGHPEGIRGAQAVAAAVFLARTGSGKDGIRRAITAQFGYDLARDPLARLADQREESCDRSVPGAINAFLVSDGVESAIARAVALGGHAEVQAGIAGGLAEAHFGALPSWMALAVLDRLPPSLMTVVRAFFERFLAAAASPPPR